MSCRDVVSYQNALRYQAVAGGIQTPVAGVQATDGVRHSKVVILYRYQ